MIKNGKLVNEEIGYEYKSAEDFIAIEKDAPKNPNEIIDIKLQNGEEIKIRNKDVIELQDKLNKVQELPDDTKSALDPLEEFLKKVDKERTAEGTAAFSMFMKFLDEHTKVEKNRNTLYTTYQEMDKVEFMHKALEIVSDDSTQKNEFGNVLKIFSTDSKIVNTLSNTLFDTLDFNSELWSIVYETCKYGDNYYEIVLDNYKRPKKIIGLNYIKPSKIARREIKGKLQYFIYKREASEKTKKKWDKPGQEIKEEGVILQPWQIIHFRLPDKESAPYGRSIFNAGIKTHRRLNLLEDSLLIYRIERAPERRVFYIDVGNMNAQESQKFVEKIKNNFNKQQIINEHGEIDTKAAAMSTLTNYYLPTRAGTQGTRIEPLAGGVQLNEIKDLDYFKNKFLKTVNIPSAFLDDSAGLQAKGSLSSMDIHFAKFVERIQQNIITGINKICAIQLFLSGFEKDSLSNFEIELTPPSSMKEIADTELFTSRFNLVQTILAMEKFPFRWVAKKYLKLSDKEIFEIELEKNVEMQAAAAAGGTLPGGEAGGLGGAFGGAPTGPTPPLGGGFEAGGVPGPEAGGVPGPEAGGVPGPEAGGVPGPEAGAPIAAGAAGAAGELVANKLINLFGKDYLIEHKDDFFKMKRDIDSVKKLFEDYESSKKENKREVNNTNIKKQIVLGELIGMSYVKNKATKKRYRKIITEEDKKHNKKIILLENKK